MFDVDKENVFSIYQANRHTPYSYSTIKRWIDDGSESIDGSTVHLEWCLTLGSKLGTSIEAIKRFHRRLNGLDENPGPIKKKRKKRQVRHEE